MKDFIIRDKYISIVRINVKQTKLMQGDNYFKKKIKNMKKVEISCESKIGGIYKIILNDEIDVDIMPESTLYYEVEKKQYLILFYADHLSDIKDINKVIITPNKNEISDEVRNIEMCGDLKILKEFTTGKEYGDYYGHIVIITNSDDDIWVIKKNIINTYYNSIKSDNHRLYNDLKSYIDFKLKDISVTLSENTLNDN